jgi:hypothetical protein
MACGVLPRPRITDQTSLNFCHDDAAHWVKEGHRCVVSAHDFDRAQQRDAIRSEAGVGHFHHLGEIGVSSEWPEIHHRRRTQG